MRIRSIVIASAAALALAGVAAYAANHGSTVSTFARATTLEGVARGDAVSDVARVQGALRSTTFRTGTPKSKGDANESTACETAENALTALRTADRAEDTTEHSATGAAATTADRTEDPKERATAEAARDAVQKACRPTRSAACTAAIDALKALAAKDRAEDRAEVHATTAAARAADRIEDAAERATHLAAVQAVVKACSS